MQYTYAMRKGVGRITELISGHDGKISLRLDCSVELIPPPGEYLLAHDPGDADAVLPVPLFQAWDSSSAFAHSGGRAAALGPLHSIPPSWSPGSTLHLRGPLGKGFTIPPDMRHLALGALGDSISRLLPLIRTLPDADIALFTDAPVPSLPAVLEIHPLSALPDSLTWADLLVLDLSIDSLPALRQTLGLGLREHLPCLAQALILTPMPCGALAECGVCAVPARKGHKLACKDGPVFDLTQLEW